MYRHTYLLVIVFLCSCVAPRENLLHYVDPGIGTAHSRWFFYTPAALPHGMAKLAPSTNGHYGNPSGWEAVGYDTRHKSIEGFAHFHEWQVGGVVVMPATGKRILTPGKLEDAERRIEILTERGEVRQAPASLSDPDRNESGSGSGSSGGAGSASR